MKFRHKTMFFALFLLSIQTAFSHDEPTNRMTVNREEDLKEIVTLAPGTNLFWPSSSYPDSFGLVRKLADGSLTLPPILLSPNLSRSLDKQQVYVTTSRPAALQEIQDLPPGSLMIWKSASTEGAFGVLEKKLDGTVSLPRLLQRTSITPQRDNGSAGDLQN